MAVLAVAAVVQPVAAAEPVPRFVSVTGSGEVRANPDVAYVTLGIESRKPALADARATVSATVDRVLALTRELKIDPRYVDSTRLQVQPDYRWNDKDSQRVLLGYVVNRQIEVELRDLDQLGALLERAVTAGANQIGEARLDSIKRKELERDALARAVADARLNAETLAKAAGRAVGTGAIAQRFRRTARHAALSRARHDVAGGRSKRRADIRFGGDEIHGYGECAVRLAGPLTLRELSGQTVK